MQKVLLNMDPDIDDAYSLILALKLPELRVFGITAVAGNAPVKTTSANARRVLEHLGAGRIPVAAGAANPLYHYTLGLMTRWTTTARTGRATVCRPRLGPSPLLHGPDVGVVIAVTRLVEVVHAVPCPATSWPKLMCMIEGSGYS